jgi:anti-anti-sigma regulatory factor
VSFADSSVVRLALKARDHVSPRGGRVVIKAPAEVRRLFELTRTAELFSLVPVHSN